MPAGDVWVKVLVNADINEPSYRYTLYASEHEKSNGINKYIIFFFIKKKGEQFVRLLCSISKLFIFSLVWKK